MKQIIQNLKTGETLLEEVPVPIPGKNQVLIQTTHSLISLGTERMLVEFSKGNLLQKARQQPDKVKQVIEKIKSEGIVQTFENVMKRLDEPLPLGYCNCGIVIEMGEAVRDVNIGDRVVSNGKHAEYVCVPENLVARIPENVTNEQATFTVIGSISLQGIRLCNPTYGETIVVYGLGLLGLIACQLLIANGCRVIGIDIDQQKCNLAKDWGVITLNTLNGDDPVKSVLNLTNGIGADGVIITASSKHSDIMSHAATMSRKRGRIILVGVTNLDLKRSEFYEKELTFQVSCSYGPGRYDENYELKGIDYPLSYVRWTEKRNFLAVLNALSQGQLQVHDLITDKVNLNDCFSVYNNIGTFRSIATIISYPLNGKSLNNHIVNLKNHNFTGAKAVCGFIGAGNFTKMTMLPYLKNSGAQFKYIASSNGLSGTTLARKYDIAKSTTDYRLILDDPEVDTVFITTRHNTHSKFVVESLIAGKNVFCEKPLALNNSQLDEIINTYNSIDHNINPTLNVGFNRRFSPHSIALKSGLGTNHGPVNIIATMNAGFIPANMWMHDMEVGGGRIIGEACHYIDLCSYLAGSEIVSVCMNAMDKEPKENTDNATILLRFKNGSNAVINYFSNGSKTYSKERIEVYSKERVFIIDNFRTTKAFGANKFRTLKTKIDKGHKNQFQILIERIQKGGLPLIPINEIVNVSKASFASIQSLKEKRWIDLQ